MNAAKKRAAQNIIEKCSELNNAVLFGEKEGVSYCADMLALYVKDYLEAIEEEEVRNEND